MRTTNDIGGPARVETYFVVKKAPDLECHVRTMEIEGSNVVELRDFIVSTRTYGRGYWIPMDHANLGNLIDCLSDIRRAGEPDGDG